MLLPAAFFLSCYFDGVISVKRGAILSAKLTLMHFAHVITVIRFAL